MRSKIPFLHTCIALLLISVGFLSCGSDGGGENNSSSSGTPIPPDGDVPSATSPPPAISNPADNDPEAFVGLLEYDYTTTVTPVVSGYIDAPSGGIVEVMDSESSIGGLKLTIPGGALLANTTITLGEVNNPPELPDGLNYVGTPLDLGPDGLVFSKPVLIEIPYTDQQLEDAGLSDDSALKLYSYDELLGNWAEETIISINTVDNKITAEITHFSFFAVVVRNVTPPEDLGTPQPGDLLYKLGAIFGEEPAKGWRPGHVGIYTGEKLYPGTGLASEMVRKFGVYNVVEALANGVQYSYYDIPNITETFEGSNELMPFNGSDVYMGAREPADIALTLQQREEIVSYVEAQVGKPYAMFQTAGVLFGMLRGSLVKGTDTFNCVGLVEKAYEIAGVSGGEGLVTFWGEEFDYGLPPALTPAEQYNKTKPAGGVNPSPNIEWATLTPSSGTECTSVLTEIAVSHTHGLSFIDSVTYATDSGYTNPALYINDVGFQGDKIAGDGIYSILANVGGKASWGEEVFVFTVTDVYGKTDDISLVFTYTGMCKEQ